MANKEFKEMLISAVQAWPCVYDHTRMDYKDAIKKTTPGQRLLFSVVLMASQ
jgi:hypothetical protein